MGRKENTKGQPGTKKTGSDRLLGENLSFVATEAYKLLRTNLFFCLPNNGEPKCRVVGVTSSVQGEGKSTTSINLSYMLAQDGKRVCLVEGDMRADPEQSPEASAHKRAVSCACRAADRYQCRGEGGAAPQPQCDPGGRDAAEPGGASGLGAHGAHDGAAGEHV